jgi:hypothetical protein
MPPKPATPVDVEAVLTKLAAQNKEKLDWRKSIVDLMKLLNLDSSLAARRNHDSRRRGARGASGVQMLPAGKRRLPDISDERTFDFGGIPYSSDKRSESLRTAE